MLMPGHRWGISPDPDTDGDRDVDPDPGMPSWYRASRPLTAAEEQFVRANRERLRRTSRTINAMILCGLALWLSGGLLLYKAQVTWTQGLMFGVGMTLIAIGLLFFIAAGGVDQAPIGPAEPPKPTHKP